MQLLSLDELVAESDFLTIHMPKTPETTGMIGAEQFAAMKPTAFVVNVARGGLIDEEALHEALVAGEIAGAGLDVFTSEPPAEGGSARPLLDLPNVVVTPHPVRARRRRRRRPVSRSPARCDSRWAAIWCPTRSTWPAA